MSDHNQAIFEAHKDVFRPESLWKWFFRVCSVAHGSSNTKAIHDLLLDAAKELNLPSSADKAGNVCIHVPATPGHESSPCVIIQGHMDMVIAHDPKVRPDFDPLHDGIRLSWTGDGWLRAEGTSLGGDDGMGVAACLAFAECRDSFVHPPVDCLFTFDEETTMEGADAVRPDILSPNCRYLINADSEYPGLLCLGSAGGADFIVRAHPKFESFDFSAYTALSVSLSGLLGGHTGVDIEKCRAQALQGLARILILTKESTKEPLRLVSLIGGKVPNAISLESHAVIVFRRESEKSVREALNKHFDMFKLDYSEVERKDVLKIDIEPVETLPAKAITVEDTLRVLSFWNLVPVSPLRMSPTLTGFVETSCCWSVCKLDEESGAVFTGLARTSRDDSWEFLEAGAHALAGIVGGELEISGKYPGWLPAPSSPLAKAAVESWEKMKNKKPIVASIHAGLECGVIMSHIPGLEAISIGPYVENPHTVQEKAEIASVEEFFNWLTDIVKRVA